MNEGRGSNQTRRLDFGRKTRFAHVLSRQKNAFQTQENVFLKIFRLSVCGYWIYQLTAAQIGKIKVRGQKKEEK